MDQGCVAARKGVRGCVAFVSCDGSRTPLAGAVWPSPEARPVGEGSSPINET